ncbi:choice-of-anchor L domain-containing protein [Peribacillus deserti]|uniref:BIG2 domain-containing protein n=1 Tax=Peribacillus deserti TaxID=673318 RepID=A0A2N5MBM3_9BACI|nr:choice-of-anchor L domain-containing protein [Peribacillus deserti]PLT31762.1 hypothetical protein CUU66_00960 [Peribacillus deserti]
MVHQSWLKKCIMLVVILLLIAGQWPLLSLAEDNKSSNVTTEEVESEVLAIDDPSSDEVIPGGQTIQVQTIENGLSPEELVRNIVGEGVKVQGVKYTGAGTAAGTFTDSKVNLGLNKGIILSTGEANGIAVTGDFPGYGISHELPGDRDLEELVKDQSFPSDPDNPENEPDTPEQLNNPIDESDIPEDPDNPGFENKTHDASILEFDFKPNNNKVSFQYVMASEEYPEYLNYSDVFGFFVNGKNIALIPQTNEPVTITNINHTKNSQYYKSNEEHTFNTQMDGMTTVLSAEAAVTPNEWNHMKLAIADFSDTAYDSNVLIKANSLNDRPAQPGSFRIGGIKHTYSQANALVKTLAVLETVTAEVEIFRENGTDGDITLAWNTVDAMGTLIDQGTVMFADGESAKKVQISFPKTQTGIYFKLMSATGGAEVDSSAGERNLTIKGIEVQQSDWFLTPGNKESLKVNAKLTSDDLEEVTDKAVYKSSKQNVVSVDQSGEMTAAAPGEAVVTITYMGLEIQIEVLVIKEESSLERIELSHESLVLKTGGEKQLQVMGVYSDSQTINLTNKVSYSSSDEEIVIVSSQGQITGGKEGSASINVSFGDLPAKVIPVEVIHEPELKDISFKEQEYSLETGQTVKLLLSALYENSKSSDITTEAAYQLVEGDSEAVKIENGFVTISSPGVYKIKAIFESKEAEVTLRVKELTEILFDQISLNLKENETVPLKVRAHYSNGNSVEVTNKTAFKSSNEQVAIVENGKLKALSEGSTTIQAIFNGKEATVQVTVEKAKKLTSITFDQKEYTVTHDQEVPFKVTAVYDNGENEDITLKNIFSLSNIDAIKIAEGKISGLKPVKDKVFVKAVYEGKEAEAEVLVAPYLSELQSDANAIEIEQGKTKQLTIKAIYSDESEKDIAAEAVYEVENPGIAAVSASGNLQAISEGTTKVTGKYQGKEIAFNITVKKQPVPAKTGFELEIKDSKQGVISNAKVMVQKAGETEMESGESDAKGLFAKEAEQGDYDVYVYKDGYLPVFQQVTVKSDEQTKLSIQLQQSELIKANFKADQMTIEEMMAARIDVKDPDNRWFYKFEAHLAFQGKPIDITYYGDNTGEMYNAQPWNLGGGYYLYPYLIPVNYKDSSVKVPMIAYMIVPGEISWLKEFFRAQLAIENLAPPQFTLVDSKVALKLPKGLSLASVRENQTLEVDIGDIKGGGTIYHEWYIRGDEKGQYDLEAVFTSKLQPMNIPVEAKFVTPKPITVWGDDALEMHIRAEKTAIAGMPYKVQMGIKNVSDAPIYYLNFELKEDGKFNYFYSPKTRISNSIEEIKPNETVFFKYLLIPRISGTLDVSKSFVLRTGGNANIKTIISYLE